MSKPTLNQLDSLLSHLISPKFTGFFNSNDGSHAKARVSAIQYVCNSLLAMLGDNDNSSNFGFEFKAQLGSIYDKSVQLIANQDTASHMNRWCNDNITLITTIISSLKRQLDYKPTFAEENANGHSHLVRTMQNLSEGDGPSMVMVR